jgi:hypothetical protein
VKETRIGLQDPGEAEEEDAGGEMKFELIGGSSGVRK